MHSNDLLSDNQSGFRLGDSTVNQLLSITHDIYVSFEKQSEARAVFLDISKAFDKVWHEGLYISSIAVELMVIFLTYCVLFFLTDFRELF